MPGVTRPLRVSGKPIKLSASCCPDKTINSATHPSLCYAGALTSSYSAHYTRMDTSWWEQRHWGITLGMEALTSAGAGTTSSYSDDAATIGRGGDSSPAARLHDLITKGFQELQPKLPSTDGYQEVQQQQNVSATVFKCGASTELSFDATGSISHLVHDGTTWADIEHTLFQLKSVRKSSLACPGRHLNCM